MQRWRQVNTVRKYERRKQQTQKNEIKEAKGKYHMPYGGRGWGLGLADETGRDDRWRRVNANAFAFALIHFKCLPGDESFNSNGMADLFGWFGLGGHAGKIQ